MRPEDVLEHNLRALFTRAYVPVRPSSAFRARLATALARPAPIQRSAFPAARVALAAGLLCALGLGLWALFARRGPESASGLERSTLARDHGAWRALDAEECAHGVPFDAGTLELAVAAHRAQEIVRVGAHGTLRLEAGARATLSGDAQQPTIALGRGRAALERLAPGPAWRIEAAGARLELAAGALRLDARPGAPDELLAWLDSGAGSYGEARTALPLHRELRFRAGALQDGRTALEDPDAQRRRVALATPAAPPDPAVESSGSTAALALALRVLAPDGTPWTRELPLVALREERLPAIRRPIVLRAQSADGSFRFQLERDGRYTLFALAPESAARKLDGLVPSATPAAIELRLEAGVTLRGRVLEAASGAPIAGATVLSEDDAPLQVLPFDASGLPPELAARTSTDADGRFVLAHLSSGRHTLRASAPGFAADWSSRLDTREAADELRFELARGGTLSVALEPPEPGMRVIASAIDTSFQRPCLSFAAGVSDAQGELAFEHLPAGAYVVLRAPSVGTTDASYATVSEGVTTQLRLGTQLRGQTLSGRVLDSSGAPLAELDVMLQSADHPDQRWSSTRSDAQGRFRFEAVAADEYSLYVGDLGRHFVELGRVRVQTLDLARDFVLGSGTLRGQLRERGRSAIAEGWLILQEWSAGSWSFRGKAQSDAQGAFSFVGLQSGRWRVIGQAQGPRLAPAISAPVELGPSALEAECQLELEPGAALEISVRDDAGRPIAGLEPVLRDARGERWQFSAADRTDSAGRFSVPGIAPGRWQLVLVRTDGTRAERTLELEVDHVTTVDIVLPNR